jgi:REP element-mobilizing transposase RayT
LNDAGQTVQLVWAKLPQHYPWVDIDAFVVMPNHVHGIIVLNDNFVGAGLKPAPTSIKRHGLPEIVRGFKTFSSRHINQRQHTPGVPLWQRNYYEHVIRSESELDRVREYISANPARWDEDINNPARIGETVGAGLRARPEKSAHGATREAQKADRF